MSLRALIPPVLIVIASALGAAGCTSASPSPPVQLTGTQLESGLLPAAAFGPHTFVVKQPRAGSHLTGRPAVEVATMSCDNLLGQSGGPGRGQTAFALDSVAVIAGPSAGSYTQTILQFASPSAATAYYTQFAAVYARCVSVTVRTTVDRVTVSQTIQSVSKVLAAGHQAVAISISATLYNVPHQQAPVMDKNDLLLTADGVDVFSVDRSDPAAEPPGPALTGLAAKLIARVRALS